jgi:hypothetical protein
MKILLIDSAGEFGSPDTLWVQRRYEWPFCALRTEESFVRDTCGDAMLKAPAEVSFRMHQLPDMDVVAEHVEHQGDVNFSCVDGRAMAPNRVSAKPTPVGVPVSRLVDAQASHRALRAFGS